MKKSTTLIAWLLLAFGTFAQAPDLSPTPIQTEDRCTKPGFAFGINLSTNGPGANLGFTLNKKGNLQLRLDGKYLPVEIKNFEYDFNKTKVILDINATIGSVGGFLDWHPFNNAFKLTLGASSIMTDIAATGLLKDSVQQGDIKISPKEVGEIKFGVTFKPSAYVGIGFGRAVPKGRVGVSLDLGAYYIQTPQLNFSATGMLEPTSNQQAVLRENIKGYSWLPVMNIGINIRLNSLKEN
ncbi:MAG: hypothetical protein L6Q78_05160 [Bacteroidia bacterium]|nr:hypothetical protein [Bacteroidia bacterium]